jgi:hypothetical protein
LVTCMHLLWKGCQLLCPDSFIEVCPDIVLPNSGAGGEGAATKSRHRRRHASGSRHQKDDNLPLSFSADDSERKETYKDQQSSVGEEMGEGYVEIGRLMLPSEG